MINFFGWNNNDILSLNFTPFMNKAFGVLLVAIISAYFISYIYKRFGSITIENQKQGITAFVIIANIVTLYAFSTQIIFYYRAQNNIIKDNYNRQIQLSKDDNFRGIYDNSNFSMINSSHLVEETTNRNKSNTSLSIFWAIYAAILTAVGFIKKSSSLRYLGLVLFILTAIQIFIDVWSLGSLYRIVSFVGLGVIALTASFFYSKYKDHLKTV